MKDIRGSFCRAIMSNSSSPLSACISPVTTTPAANRCFKRPSVCHFKGSAKGDKTSLDSLTADDHGAVQTGDAPWDAQGATEPNGITTPVKSCTCSYKVTLPMCGPADRPAFHNNLPTNSHSDSFLPTTLVQCGRIRQEKDTSSTINDATLVGQSVSPCVVQESPHNLGDGDHCAGIHGESPQNANALNRNPFENVLAKPWPTEGENVDRNSLKSSNVSESDRKRGPIKKRHYQPDALDLSTKKTKSKEDRESSHSESVAVAREMFQKQLRLSSEHKQARSVNTSCIHGNTTALPRQRFHFEHKLIQERISTDANQESTEITQKDNSASGISHGVPSFNVQTDRKCKFAGDTDLDRKPPVSIKRDQCLNQMSAHAANSYSSTIVPVPLIPSTEFMTKWVLHVTQGNGMFAMQHLQAKLSADCADQTHSPACHIGCHGNSSLLPTLKDAGHQDVPLLQKPYACEHCSSRFKHRHHVIRHMRAHNGERPFHCEHCGATFARKCVLTNHRRTHTGEKPYICSECGDTFSRKHHLVIHQRTHSGEKPYQCRDCGAAFARSHHVNRHRKTHEKEHEVDAHIERLNSAVTDDQNLHHLTTPTVLSSLKSESADIIFYQPLIENETSLKRNSTSMQAPETGENACNILESETRAPTDIKL